MLPFFPRESVGCDMRLCAGLGGALCRRGASNQVGFGRVLRSERVPVVGVQFLPF